MNKTKPFLTVALSGLVFLSACAIPLPAAGPGFLVTSTTEGIAANNGVESNKRAEVCSINVLGVASVGDSSIEAARNKADIQAVSTINREYFSILSLFVQACTIVSGS